MPSKFANSKKITGPVLPDRVRKRRGNRKPSRTDRAGNPDSVAARTSTRLAR